MQFVVNETPFVLPPNEINKIRHTHIPVDFEIPLLRFFSKILNSELNQTSAYVPTSHLTHKLIRVSRTRTHLGAIGLITKQTERQRQASLYVQQQCIWRRKRQQQQQQ
uniref:Uncharacterized protein n=1 Tax=Bactrocera dorsalis TaxID=27457 RepID=A0A034WNN8_BACDO